MILAVGAVGLTLSRRVTLNAGSDHVAPAAFSATVPPNGELCQVHPYLPPGAASAQIVIGTHGHPVPAFDLRFISAAGTVVSRGALPAGTRMGPIAIPLHPTPGSADAIQLCLRLTGTSKVVIAGLGIPPDPTDETVNGARQLGRISVVYAYGGRPEPWWSHVGAIDERFGLGKAPYVGSWTLPACVILLLAGWGLALRQLAHSSP